MGSCSDASPASTTCQFKRANGNIIGSQVAVRTIIQVFPSSIYDAQALLMLLHGNAQKRRFERSEA